MESTPFVPTTLTLTFDQNLIDRATPWGIVMDKDRFKNFFDKISEAIIVTDEKDSMTVTFERSKCYEWGAAGDKVKKGAQHGMFNIGNQHDMVASRFAYIIAHGLKQNENGIANDDLCPCGSVGRKGKRKTYKKCCRLEVTHQCKSINGLDSNGKCVNPLHLVAKTHSENMGDIHIHKTGRGKVSRGENHGNAEINEDDVKNIWADLLIYKKGTSEQKKQNHVETYGQIVKKYGKPSITLTKVKDISAGRTWNHITMLERPQKRYDARNKRNHQKIIEETERKKRKME